jgi:hypothetical protein
LRHEDIFQRKGAGFEIAEPSDSGGEKGVEKDIVYKLKPAPALRLERVNN